MTERTETSTTEWLTPRLAAKALGITTTHLARLADKGTVRAIRPVAGGNRRYAAADIEAIIAREPWKPGS